MKKLISLMMIALLVLSACGEETSQESQASEMVPEAVENTESTADSGDFTIGILQFAPHASLDNCREGFIQGLADAGFEEGVNITYDIQNAQADMALASQIADSFVANNYDMIVAIATPAAMSAYNATMDTEIPVVYTAVTDPIEAQLANEDGTSLGNVTGTSDELPVEAQLQMIREMLPEAKKIGILYTTSEANSASMIRKYKELAPNYDFELVEGPVSSTADIPLATDKLLSEVDAVTNILDNTVVNSLPVILDKAQKANVPVFGSEIEQVRIGSIAAEGVEYIALGNQTGQMAAKILNKEAVASELPFETISESKLYLNTQAASNLGIEIPSALLDRAQETFEEITPANQSN